ncbi:SLC13 family permease [Lentisphaera profundi]|uniref:SLC13 family permease n=1 Tax=Lentisphaera profundi TaxID=1658616 RepID=A0ABY7VR33_9BACT|nr:SLC13 family permease [Lentisphaera profundi]WDE96651.1 SLC13 family permease [Lentisphaera profundi]
MNKPSPICTYLIFPGIALVAMFSMNLYSFATFTMLLTGLMFLSIFKDVAQPSVCAGGSFTFLLLGSAIHGHQRGMDKEQLIDYSGQLLSGFSSPTLITVGALFIVAEGVRNSGWLEYASQKILNNETNEKKAALRIAVVVTPLSAFMNNTPVVAMFIPAIKRWANQHTISPSRLLLPMVFFTTLGGMCTLIGTSTNLIVHGKMQQSDIPELHQGLGMFTLTPIAIFCLILGVIWIVFFAIQLLPKNESHDKEQIRTYIMKMKVSPVSPVDGKRVKDTNLQHIDGLVIMSASRPSGNTANTNIRNWILLCGDILTFSGEKSHMDELQNIPGLIPVDLDSDNEEYQLYELMIPQNSALTGKSIEQIWFRQRYMAAVISLHRGSQDLANFFQTKLKASDTLLIAARPTFVDFWKNSSEFTILSEVENTEKTSVKPPIYPLIITFFMSALPALGIINIMTSALLASLIMIALQKDLQASPLKAIDLNILVVIGAALGLSVGLETSGAAAQIAHSLTFLIPADNPQVALLLCCLFTWVLTELITNTAAVALTFPIVVDVANSMNVSPLPFVIGLAIAGSASFATPIGYQTNMMVYAPGNYKFTDYLKSGLPLSLLVISCASLIIPHFFKF